MRTTTEIYQLIQEENIIVNELLLPNRKLGLYRKDSDGDFIFFHPSLNSNTPYLRCVLAEELGHHFTLIGNYNYTGKVSYQTFINSTKEENKAIRWATEYLIETNKLLEMFYEENFSIYSLADSFDVTPEFMLQKLYFMSYDLPQWYVANNKLLCLTCLPSFFISQIFDDQKVLETKLKTYRRLSCKSTYQKKQRNTVLKMNIQ